MGDNSTDILGKASTLNYMERTDQANNQKMSCKMTLDGTEYTGFITSLGGKSVSDTMFEKALDGSLFVTSFGEAISSIGVFIVWHPSMCVSGTQTDGSDIDPMTKVYIPFRAGDTKTAPKLARVTIGLSAIFTGVITGCDYNTQNNGGIPIQGYNIIITGSIDVA